MLGDAFVVISPDTGNFRKDTIAGVNKALAGLKFTVPVTPDVSGFEAALAEAAQKLASTGAGINVTPDMGDFGAKAAAAAEAQLAGARATIPVVPDIEGIQAALTRLKAAMVTAGLADFLDVNLPMGKVLTQITNSCAPFNPFSTVKRQCPLHDPICDTFDDDCTACIG